MLLYSLIMFIVAMVFMAVSIAIYRGKTDLIHDYHQTNVVDKTAYGKALFVIPISAFLSGIIGLMDHFAVVAVVVLMIGLCAGVCCIVSVQKKYNKGVF